mmetsp:Transcript_82895/g.208917  ORF Transcript_82895/g.208917 Transcript_82895/m.208917 type:complete len:222 (-) Transcript_82895:35-700(-)
MPNDGGSPPGYGNGPGYWDERYAKDPEPFEWLESWSDLRGFVEDATSGNLSSRVLHVGCGNSAITEQMYDYGYRDIVNIDTSRVVIGLMTERNAERELMKWEVMDATSMELEDCSFDLVLDKSVLDTFACMDHAQLKAGKYLKEVYRVLRPGGTFLCVSFGGPDTRLPFLQMKHLEFEIQQVRIEPKQESSNPHFAYLCKRPMVSTGAADLWPEVAAELTY